MPLLISTKANVIQLYTDISLEDIAPNVEIFRRPNMPSVLVMLALLLKQTCDANGRWQTAKSVFYGEMAMGKKRVGGQRLRCKDVQKHHLKATNIPVDTWESVPKGQSAIHNGIASIEQTCQWRQSEQHTTNAALQHLWQRLQSTHYPGVTSHLQAQDLSSQLRSSTAQESRTQRHLQRWEKNSKSLNTAGVNARDKYSPSNKTLPLDTDDDKNGYNQRNSSHAGRHTTIETTMIVQ